MAWNNRIVIIVLPVLLLLVIFTVVKLVPDSRLDSYQKRSYSSDIYDRNGILIAVTPLSNGLRREYRSFEQIPEWVRDMFISSEDSSFNYHFGLDPIAIIRAAILNMRSGRIESGASTITMQLAGMIWPGEPGYAGKLNEILHALYLEIKLSKKAILELWLNNLPFGNNVEGITSAARAFFQKDLSNLTPSEVLFLTIIPRRPALYTPIYNNQAILDKAVFIGEKRGYNISDFDQLINKQADSQAFPDKAPHFTRFITSQMQKDVFSIRSSLDLDIQETAAALLSSQLENSGQFRISNGAIFIIENSTGEIAAYIGSGDWNDTETSGQIDGIRILRQPGSTLKPYLYAMSFETAGFTPATMLADLPLVLGSTEVYSPENYDNRFRGPVLLRSALASSLNVPAVKTVVAVGVQNFADRLIDCGFESIKEQREYLGSGIAVGNAEVSLFELVQGFSIFARDGYFLPVIPFHEKDPVSQKMTGFKKVSGHRVFDKKSAALIKDILKREYPNPYLQSANSLMDNKFEGIFKTGTSNQFNNIWALGSSVKYTVGVWMGNFSGETVMGKPGSSIPLSIATQILLMIDPNSKFEPIENTERLMRIKVCSLSGMQATEYCKGTIDEFIPSDKIPQPCTVHTASGTYLPYEFREYAAIIESGLLHGTGELSIVSPAHNSRYYSDPSLPSDVQSISLSIEGNTESCRVLYDGALVYTGPTPCFFYLPLKPGNHRIRVYNDDTSSTSVVSQFEVID